MTLNTTRNRLILLAFIASATLAVVAWQVQRITADNQRRQQGEMLSTVLETSHQAVNSWSRAHLATAVIWANSPEIIKFASKLLALPGTQRDLVHSPLQAQVREWLQPLIDAMGYQGYFIIGPDNLNLSSTRDENIGVSNLLTEQEGVLARMWAGQPALSLPWRSDVPLPDEQGNLQEGLPSMFAGAPIHDDDGRVIAILTFRIDPGADFTKILQQGRLGMTGETYAFNRHGLLISESRFDEQLRQSGLLAPGEAGILNLTLRNPGIKILGRAPSGLGTASRPAAAPLVDDIARDLDGYLNYRGVPVIGAWLWDDGLGFGIATEVEMAEAYQPLVFNRYAISGMALFSILLLCSLTWVFIRSRERLAGNEARLREAQHIGRMGNWSWDVGSGAIHWSDEIYRIFGRSPETFRPTYERFIAMLHPDDVARVSAAEQAAFSSGRKHSIDYRVLLPDGSIQWVHEEAVADFDKRGRVLRLSGTVQDITERRKAEQALRESEMRFKAVLDNSPTMIYVKDLQGRYLFVNKTFSELFGIGSAAAKGRRDHEILPAAVADILVADDRKVYESQAPLEMEERIPVGNDQRTYIATKFCLRNEQGEPYAVGSIATDITHRMRMEEERAQLQRQLQQAQKMETIGQLTGGIAHDFNNMLACILGYTTLAYNNCVPDREGKLAHYLQEVRKAGERGRDLIKQLLDFSRTGDSTCGQLSLAAVVTESLKMLHAVMPAGVRIDCSTPDDLPSVFADPVQLHQALVNLCINARDAMEDKGVLKISAQRMRVSGVCCASCHEMVAGDFVVLAVKDNGSGMQPEQLEKIFDPFYTTKEVGKGTGMGLSVVHGIMHAYGGHVLLSSAAGHGTEFRLLFPLQGGVHALEIDQQGKPPLTECSLDGHVMVVDDEVSIGRFLKELLVDRGCQVSVFHDPGAALAAFEADPDAIDLLITDQAMPGMTGMELATRFLDKRPHLPVILCSGFGKDVDEHSARDKGIGEFFYKPIDIGRLLTLLPRLLRGPARQ